MAAVLAVVVLAGGVVGYGVYRGWFDSTSVEGSTEGFEPDAAPEEVRESGSWPEYGLTPERTRANTALTGLRPPFRRVWEYEAGALVEFPPVVADGRAFVGTNGKLAIALDLRTGRELWRHELLGRIASSPAVAGGLVVFTSFRGEVVAYEAGTGERVWGRRAGAPVESSPLVIGDSLYIGTLAGRVLKLALDTGGVRWEARARGDVKAGLTRSGDNVVVGDYAGYVTAFRMGDGAVAWQRESPGTRLSGAGRFYGGAAAAFGRIYIGNINGRVVSLDADTGEVAWVRVLGDFVYSSPAVAGRRVFVGSYDQHMYALDAVTGRVVWRFDAGERISGSPTVIGDLVHFSTIARTPSEGRTFLLEADTGEPVLTFPDGRYTPSVAIEGLLLLTGVNTIYALRPR
ncbi:MAG: PQQ-binding-like beta-propeller repeat protein [Miltoncostaeaceae bacterium]